MKLKDDELANVLGGAITATFLNSIARLITTLLDMGRSVGSAISRYKNKNYCA